MEAFCVDLNVCSGGLTPPVNLFLDSSTCIPATAYRQAEADPSLGSAPYTTGLERGPRANEASRGSLQAVFIHLCWENKE